MSSGGVQRGGGGGGGDDGPDNRDLIGRGSAVGDRREGAKARNTAARFPTQRLDFPGVAAMDGGGQPTAFPAFGRARAGALAAMEAAAAVLHGGLQTGGAVTGAGATAAGGQEVAGAGAVLEPAAPIQRQGTRL
jgi:hypothetical protein